MRIAMLSGSGKEQCGIPSYSETLYAHVKKAEVETARIPVEQKQIPVAQYIARTKGEVLHEQPDLVHIHHEFSIFRGISGTDFIRVLLARRKLGM